MAEFYKQVRIFYAKDLEKLEDLLNSSLKEMPPERIVSITHSVSGDSILNERHYCCVTYLCEKK